jgi:hypothetical protein
MFISENVTVFKIIHTSPIRNFSSIQSSVIVLKTNMVRLNCRYHVEDHSASFLAQQNFCSKCAQPMFMFTPNLFHVTRNIHIVNKIYA